jgi:hypothetical protein
MSIQDIPSSRQDRSLGELFTDLTRETTTLVRQEVALAKSEISAKASRLGKEVGLLAAGGVVAYVGLLTLVAASILALIQAGMPTWGSALLVGGIVVITGGILIGMGLKAFKQTDAKPHQTPVTLKEDVSWAKDQPR